MEAKDFCVARVGRAKHLVEIIKLGEESLTGRDHTLLPSDDDVTVEVAYADVLAVVGSKPTVGNAYGCKVEPYIRVLEHPKFGAVHVWREGFKKPEWLMLSQMLGECWALLDKMNYTDVINNIEIHVRNASGRWAGTYKCVGGEDMKDIMTFKPRDIMGMHMRQLVMHELAHGIWFRAFNAKKRARWCSLYHRYLNVVPVTVKDLKEIRELFKGTEFQTVKEASGEIEDEHLNNVLWACVDHASNYHKLSIKNLNDMLQSATDITPFFPTEELELTDIEESIGEYATTSPEEFFAEACSYYLCGLKIPERIESLVVSTVGERPYALEKAKPPAEESSDD